MIITFEELRKVKDSLPDGSMKRIANELHLDVETVRNYFGGANYDKGSSVDVHYEKHPGGGYVKLDNTAIWEAAKRMLEKEDAAK